MVLFLTWCLSTGKGPMCAINRSSIFFLLSIQIHLCDLIRSLYMGLGLECKKSQGLIWKVLSVGIPCLLMGISYGGLFEFRDVCHGSLMVSSFLMTNACLVSQSVECHENCETSDNYNLNVARHAFSCSMRFGPIWSVWFDALASSYRNLRCICCQVFQHGNRMGWVSLATSFWVSSSFFIPSLSSFDVPHYSHGWRSIRIVVFGKGLVWWDVAILCAQCLLFFFECWYFADVPLVTMLRKDPFHLEQRIYDFVLHGFCRICCL